MFINIYEEGKDKSSQYERERYKNLSKHENQRQKKKLHNAKKIKVRQHFFWVNIQKHFLVYGLALKMIRLLNVYLYKKINYYKKI